MLDRRYRLIDDTKVSTLAGTGGSGFKDGPLASAMFKEPRGVAVDSKGRVYVTDSANNRIRLVTP